MTYTLTESVDDLSCMSFLTVLIK